MSSSGIESIIGAATGLVAGLLVFVGILVLICLALVIVQIIGMWKILEKGGKPGWGALIPFYNQYLLCDMVGVWPWWILIVVVAAFLAGIPFIGGIISFAVSIYFSILLNVSLARSFGKEDGFAVGLILLAPVFYMILGVGKDNEYQGKKPMEDVVLNAINKNSNNTTTNSSNDKKKFCTSCGAEITTKSKFCPSCGKEVK